MIVQARDTVLQYGSVPAFMDLQLVGENGPCDVSVMHKVRMVGVFWTIVDTDQMLIGQGGEYV